MLYDTILPAKVPTGVPEMRYYQHTSGATFRQGAPLVFASGEVNEGGVNPTAIVGISLAPAGNAPGLKAANNPIVSTGLKRNVTVAVANRNTIFSSRIITGGALPIIAPVQADIGVSYGLTAISGIWYVDKSKTAGNARVVIVDIDTNWNGVYWKFLESALAMP